MTNRVIEDMLIMYVMEQPSKWEDYIHLVEFSYNNGYRASLKMSPFEALFGRKCNTLVSWENPTNRAINRPNFLKEMEEQMTKIRKNLKVAWDMHKSYADKNKFFRDFKVGEHVFLQVKVKRSSIRLGCSSKLEMRYCGPFKILEKIGPFVYMLTLPASMKVHILFHVLFLKKYVPDPNHIIEWTVIQVEHEGDFLVEPIHIVDRKFKVFQNKSIGMVKV
jgi:hypothetical protein